VQVAGLEIKLGNGESLEELAEALAERLARDLEDRLAEMLSEKVEAIHSLSGIWVPRMLKMTQVAEILQVPESKARQLTASGEIPRLNLSPDPAGKTIRVDPRDLEAWLDANQEFPARRDELRRWMEQSRKLYQPA
jgi:hypothetical protein